MSEEFNERFESVEQALKYIADSQAKSEFIHKREKVEFDKRIKFLKKQISELENTIKSEKQFNKQVELNIKLKGLPYNILVYCR